MKVTDSSSPVKLTNDTMKVNELLGTFGGADENHDAKGKARISEKISTGMDIGIWCKQFNVDFGRAELGKAM